MDSEHFVLYSCSNGKFYLVNFNSLTKLLYNKIKKTGTKSIYILKNELNEIIDKALNPELVDYCKFLYPIVVGIMVTNKCNLNCKYCIANNGNSYSKEDSFHDISEKILKELKDSSVVSVIVSGGEPTLYKHLPEFLLKLSNGNYFCLLDTNGTLITEELIDTLKKTNVIARISLDSINASEHDTNRGMFNATLANIIKMRKENIDLRINTVLNKMNAKNIDDLAKWISKNGIKKWHVFKLQRAFSSPELWIDDTETTNILSHLEKTFGTDIDILFKFSKTNDGFASFVIDSDGICFSTQNKTIGCNQKHVFGDITQESLSEIWQNTPVEYRLRHYNKYLSYTNKNY